MNTTKFTSKVIKANTHGNTLRCTVPHQIVSLLNLKDGDSVKWIVNEGKNETTVVIEKLIL